MRVNPARLATRWPAATLLVVALASCAPRPQVPDNVLFISLDTTRRDHLSTYGYERPTAPHLDRLAESAAVFENAISQWTATNPAHTSMFTGLYPHAHGVGTNTAKLPAELTTLAETLAGAGFRTGAFVSGYTLRSGKTGIERGFEVYESRFEGTRRDGEKTSRLALDWLGELDPQERWFLFLHFYDAHGPYRGDGRYLELFESEERGPRLEFIPKYQRRRGPEGNILRHLNDYVDRYDAEIRYQDEVLGRVLAEIDLDRTLVVVTSDHGETMNERSKGKNLSHATGVHDEQIRIPLLVHSPGIEASRHREVVETVDLLPTILGLLELPPSDPAVQGQNLVPLLRGAREERADRLAFSAVWARDKWQDRQRAIESVRSRRWKLVRYPGLEGDELRLFDLMTDPLEREDLGDAQPEIRDRLLAALEGWRTAEAAVAEEAELTAEDIENLKALGYLN